MGFTHYYKIKVYVDDEMSRYETWKYVFAHNENEAIERVLRHYDNRCDYARILEMYTYPIQDVMMFECLINT